MKISDYKLTKEHPVCRRTIVRNGFKPVLYQHKDKEVWDGYTYTHLNDMYMAWGSLAKQMRLMLKQGYWGDKSDVIVDQELWFKIDDIWRTEESRLRRELRKKRP